MTILGIDPGTRKAGWSILRLDARGVHLIAIDTLKLPSTEPLAARVGIFGEFVRSLIVEHGITIIALETAFVAKNPQTFVKLGYLRGVLCYLAHTHSLTIEEFAPMQVKQAITGWGAAPKEQVARVVHQLFPHLPPQRYEDSTDALAVALAGLWQAQHKERLATITVL